MKKIVFIVIAGLILTGTGCNIGFGEGKATAYFWTNDPGVASNGLYIDEVYKGKIPYISPDSSGTGSRTVKQRGLAVVIQPGEYKVTVVGNIQTTLCKGELELRMGSGNTKISSDWNNSKCIVQVVVGD